MARSRQGSGGSPGSPSKEEGRSLGVQLLADTRTVFANADKLHTRDILAALCDLPEFLWKDMRGSPLNDRGLAHRLNQYGIKSCDVKINGMNLKGYTRESFHEFYGSAIYRLHALLPKTALPALPALPMGKAMSRSFAMTTMRGPMTTIRLNG